MHSFGVYYSNFLLIISVIFSLININNENILNNVSIIGIDVSNMSQEKAKEAISEVVNAKLTEEMILKKMIMKLV